MASKQKKRIAPSLIGPIGLFTGTATRCTSNSVSPAASSVTSGLASVPPDSKAKITPEQEVQESSTSEKKKMERCIFDGVDTLKTKRSPHLIKRKQLGFYTICSDYITKPALLTQTRNYAKERQKEEGIRCKVGQAVNAFCRDLGIAAAKDQKTIAVCRRHTEMLKSHVKKQTQKFAEATINLNSYVLVTELMASGKRSEIGRGQVKAMNFLHGEVDVYFPVLNRTEQNISLENVQLDTTLSEVPVDQRNRKRQSSRSCDAPTTKVIKKSKHSTAKKEAKHAESERPAIRNVPLNVGEETMFFDVKVYCDLKQESHSRWCQVLQDCNWKPDKRKFDGDPKLPLQITRVLQGYTNYFSFRCNFCDFTKTLGTLPS